MILPKKKAVSQAVSKKEILKLCKAEKSLKKIAQYFVYKDVYKFKNNYINELLDEGK